MDVEVLKTFCILVKKVASFPSESKLIDIHIHAKERIKLLNQYKETLNYHYSTLKLISVFGLYHSLVIFKITFS